MEQEKVLRQITIPRWFHSPIKPNLDLMRIRLYLWETNTMETFNTRNDGISIACSEIWPGKHKSHYEDKFNKLVSIPVLVQSKSRNSFSLLL
jgi:hypothetical protein